MLITLFGVLLVGVSLASTQENEALVNRAGRLQKEGKADSSLAAFRMALSLPGNTPSQRLRCLNGIADNLVRLGRLDTASAVLERAMGSVEHAGDDLEVELSQTYSTLAIISAYRESDVSRAVIYARRACTLRELRFGGDHINTARTYYVLGYAFKKAGEFDSAMVYLSKALAIQEGVHPQEDQECATTLSMLGAVCENVGRLSEAAQLYIVALEYLERSGQTRSDQAMACHGSLATIFNNLGQVRDAQDQAAQCLDLSIQLFGPASVFTAGRYTQLGQMLAESGDYERGFEYCERALAIAASSKEAQPSGLADICRMLSRIERLRGRPTRALPFLRRGLEIVRSLENAAVPETALLLDEAALVYSALEDKTQARTYCRASIRTRRALSSGRPTVDIAAGHLTMADFFLRDGTADSAAVHLTESERILASCSDRNTLLEGRVQAMHGTLDYHGGKYESAALHYQEALRIVTPGLRGTGFAANPTGAGVENGGFLVEVLSSKASALQKLAARGDTACGRSALAALECAADLAGRMQRSFSLEGSKLSLRERTAAIYRSGVEAGAALFDATGDTSFSEWAFRFAERSRAGLLAENIERLKVGDDPAVPDSLREKERLLMAGIRACQLAIDRSRGHASTELRASLFALRQELDCIQMNQPAPETRQLPVPSIQSLQAVIPENILVLEYAKTDGRLRIFALGRCFFQIYTGPSSAAVTDQVRSLRRSIKTMDWKNYLAVAEALFSGLISPVQQLLKPGMRLVIIPDEELALLPFEALVPPGTGHRKGTPDYASVPYLIRSFEISYAPSTALFYRGLTSRGEAEHRSFAGFAPVFRDDRNRLFSALRSIHVDGKEYGELRHSEEEVRSILSSFRRSGSEGAAYLDGSATKGEMLRALESNTHVHIATHGFANDSLPGLSGLVFAPPAGARDPEILYARETYGLRSDADLLVLSACETGLGRIARGEGVMALTHGFLSAGIHNVVYSLWRVMDRPSTDLMKTFYRDLTPGTRYEAALRRAKLEMIRTPATAFPYHWAGFVLVHGG